MRNSVNFAIPMGLILERSEVLVASLDTANDSTGPGNEAAGDVADVELCNSCKQFITAIILVQPSKRVVELSVNQNPSIAAKSQGMS